MSGTAPSHITAITIDNPPVNALSRTVVDTLTAQVAEANADPAVTAIVIIGKGRGFIAGADINNFLRVIEHGDPMIELSPMLAVIENCAKPVIAAIHGHALGGGLETAMACHYRVAVPDAKVGQPEVNLGLIPGAGGTQRLPRLVGIEKAAEMCALGAPVTATEAHALGIIDEIIEGDLLAGALAFAATVANQPPRRTCDRNERLRSTDLSALRAQVHRHAQLAAIDALQAAGRLAFEEGLRYERKLFLECLHSEEAKQMIAEFFASRASKKPTSH